MITLGITGGVATGKTTVARMFSSLGVKVVDSDRLVHGLIQPGGETCRKIVNLFGSTILGQDNSIDRRKLGEIVFNDSVKRKDLEGIIHPEVKKLIRGKLSLYERSGEEIVAVEIPLLFEANMENVVDRIVVVVRKKSLQERALRENKNLSEENALKRISAQLPIEEKITRADFVIDNNGSLPETKKQVGELVAKIKTMVKEE